MRIFSNERLPLKTMKYYKYPFNNTTRQDDSLLFKVLFTEYKRAFKSAYSNYLQHKPFIMTYEKYIMIYDHKDVKVSRSLKQLLEENEIDYVESTLSTSNNSKSIIMEDEYNNGFLNRDKEEKLLIVHDVCLLFDYFVNLECPTCLPFLLSEYEFEAGIVSYARMIEKEAVQYKDEIIYNYYVDGYFYGSDYKEYFMHDVDFDKPRKKRTQ